MTPERFETLAEAYGGEIGRWPEDARDAAAAFMAGDPERARQILSRESALDEALDGLRPLAVRHEFREAVIAGAPVRRLRRPMSDWLFRAGLGAGLAAACAAGLLMGVTLAEPVTNQDTDAVTQAMSSYELPGDDLAEGV